MFDTRIIFIGEVVFKKGEPGDLHYLALRWSRFLSSNHPKCHFAWLIYWVKLGSCVLFLIRWYSISEGPVNVFPSFRSDVRACTPVWSWDEGRNAIAGTSYDQTVEGWQIYHTKMNRKWIRIFDQHFRRIQGYWTKRNSTWRTGH